MPHQCDSRASNCSKNGRRMRHGRGPACQIRGGSELSSHGRVDFASAKAAEPDLLAEFRTVKEIMSHRIINRSNLFCVPRWVNQER
ncbi:hypothetical protein JTB14_005562 [Gonioctena quinquepunctata]|nr:hypothetical protein JTB14_005562 [Gonioctena quinquepunctata]